MLCPARMLGYFFTICLAPTAAVILPALTKEGSGVSRVFSFARSAGTRSRSTPFVPRMQLRGIPLRSPRGYAVVNVRACPGVLLASTWEPQSPIGAFGF
jgi:hypothetical protein